MDSIKFWAAVRASNFYGSAWENEARTGTLLFNLDDNILGYGADANAVLEQLRSYNLDENEFENNKAVVFQFVVDSNMQYKWLESAIGSLHDNGFSLHKLPCIVLEHFETTLGKK